MHGNLPSLIKMCLTTSYLSVWGFSLKTPSVSENINKHAILFTLKFQLEKKKKVDEKQDSVPLLSMIAALPSSGGSELGKSNAKVALNYKFTSNTKEH